MQSVKVGESLLELLNDNLSSDLATDNELESNDCGGDLMKLRGNVATLLRESTQQIQLTRGSVRGRRRKGGGGEVGKRGEKCQGKGK